MPNNTTSRPAKLTPMLRQYLQIKKEHPDKILFYRMGDFYEMFFDDAIQAAKLLKITLTSRNKKDDHPIPMCGFPHHAAGEYLSILTAAGCKVAICDQMEDPKEAKGLVKREVTKVITPGISFEEHALAADQHNYLAAVALDHEIFGLATLDITTGSFQATETATLNELLDELAKVSPRELLLAEDHADHPWQLTLTREFPDLHLTRKALYPTFHHDAARERLCQQFNTLSLDGFGARELRAGIMAAGAALAYVQETQRQQPLAHINRLQVYHTSSYMHLDKQTIINLELLHTIHERKKNGSLFGLLDRCQTAMGSRLLKQWLLYPLLVQEKIERRLDAIQLLVEEKISRHKLQEKLKQIYDLERLGGKLASLNANGRDLISLKDSLAIVPRIKSLLTETAGLPPMLEDIVTGLHELAPLILAIETTLLEDQPISIKEGNLIRPGINTDLDDLKLIRSRGREWILQLEREEKERTGINGLKIRYNRVFGYYIEVTHRNRDLVPVNYLRKQTLANADRYITPTLKEYEEKIIGAEEKIVALEYELFCDLRRQAAAEVEQIQHNSLQLAMLDCLTSLAEVADEQDYCRPVIDASRQALQITDGRHPTIEAINRQERFIPNDCSLDGGKEQIWIITGPNMAGKSTFLRQNGVIALMAQIGSYIPATGATMPIFDQIFTRVGAADNLSRGLSTFMVEMTETAQIINNATVKSLIILDEIGRGTSTFDGVSIAWAVAEHIHDHTAGLTLFATHYHELTELALTKKRIKNYNVAIKQQDDGIVFLRQILPGATNRSYGIEVAKLAGLPASLISRAQKILANLEQAEFSAEGQPRPAGISEPAVAEPTSYLPMLEPFTSEIPFDLEAVEQARQLLKKTDINRTTPIRALTILDKIKQLL
ncbi:MAG: DNA mismatch repair protein MutS [Deltaproteobacteria bacterium]|nr:DNA mismatch repair protein MutS [Candidatus Anaeroferrophillus wilburensis]MBN2888455.1 DNA mismatch repair protein MutS [Deltaproteobacteria bacterium]